MTRSHPFWSLAAVLVLAGSAVACDVAAPDPQRNPDVVQPALTPVSFDQLDTFDAFAGDLVLRVPTDTFRQTVDAVRVYVNGEFHFEDRRAPFDVLLSTSQFADGRYEVAVGVRFQNAGVIGLADGMSTYFVDSLAFDQTVPTPVAVTSVAAEEEGVRLTWDASSDRNFRAYILLRRPARETFFEPVDTLFDRSRTSYLDASIPFIYGYGTEYAVQVWNGARAVTGAACRGEFGGSVRVQYQDRNFGELDDPPIISPDGRLLVTRSPDSLAVYSAESLDLLSRRRLSDVIDPSVGWTNAFFRPDGSRAFIRGRTFSARPYNGSRNSFGVSQHDPLTFEPLETDVLPAGFPGRVATEDVIADNRGRVFLMLRSQVLTAFDADTGHIRGEVALPEGNRNYSYSYRLSRDGDILYLMHRQSDGVSSRFYLYAIDISTDTLRILNRTEVAGFRPTISHLVPESPDLYVETNLGTGLDLLRYRGETLELADRPNLPEGTRLIATTDTYHYVGGPDLNPETAGFGAYRTTRYDSLLEVPAQSWLTTEPVVAVDPDDRRLFASDRRRFVWGVPAAP